MSQNNINLTSFNQGITNVSYLNQNQPNLSLPAAPILPSADTIDEQLPKLFEKFETSLDHLLQQSISPKISRELLTPHAIDANLSLAQATFSSKSNSSLNPAQQEILSNANEILDKRTELKELLQMMSNVVKIA